MTHLIHGLSSEMSMISNTDLLWLRSQGSTDVVYFRRHSSAVLSSSLILSFRCVWVTGLGAYNICTLPLLSTCTVVTTHGDTNTYVTPKNTGFYRRLQYYTGHVGKGKQVTPCS